MRSRGLGLALSGAAVLVLGCDTRKSLEPSPEPPAPSLAKGGGGGGGTDFATLTPLPALSSRVHGEAYAVDRTGSLIVGYSWDSNDRMNPVTWRLQNGAWTITALPYAAYATSATARGVNDRLDVAGNDFPASTPHALGCNDLGEVYGMSAGGQILVGRGGGASQAIGTAALWQPGSCREDLPPLVAGGGASARAINGDATIVGGSAALALNTSFVPVRWKRSGGAWQIAQLDSRPGSVHGANNAGDLVGQVQVPCGSASCSRGIIWYSAGGSRELGTLGGPSTAPRAINSAGEVVGLSTLANGDGFPFIWSETLGMRQLPVSYGAWAFAVSGVRSDGTRLVVGAGGRPFAALVWVVRNP
jgi:uncharacterized membrane protein